jgi:hypothetical protein
MLKILTQIRKLLMAFQISKFLIQANVEIKLHSSFKAELGNFLEELLQIELKFTQV